MAVLVTRPDERGKALVDQLNQAGVVYRLHEDMFNNGLDIVVIARSTARDISYHETESALLHLGGLHKVINR